MSKINLGDTVRDSVTSFVGVATARARYYKTSDVRIRVEGLDKHTGLPVDYWFDESRLVSTQPTNQETE